jgi:hypothetical protein
MSYSKDLQSYPEEFGRLVELGALQGVSLPMPSAAEAKRLSGRLYAYKGSLKKAVHEADCPDTVRDLYRLSQKCQMRVEGSLLILRPMDQDPDALLIRAALGDAEENLPALQAMDTTSEGQILVPINPAHLPPWLADLAIKRAENVTR